MGGSPQSAFVSPRFPVAFYRLQRARDINGPWVTLSTETAPANGMLEYLDSSEAANSTFYRVRMD
jgi:hypothetical protein